MSEAEDTMIETPPGVPDDIAYLGDRLDGVSGLLAKMLAMMAGTAKQRVLVKFHFDANATLSTIYSTTIRLHAERIVIPRWIANNAALDFLAGSARMLQGFQPSSDAADLPVSFDLEPGMDYQFIVQTGAVAPFGTTATDVWIVATIEEGGQS